MTSPDASAPSGLPDIRFYRAKLEKALRHGLESCTFDTLVAAVQSGGAQYWPCGSSVFVTQIAGGNTLHFWAAAGKMDEIERALPLVLAWGQEHGCTRATLTGRPGWLRSFLSRTGWVQSPIVAMELNLSGQK